MTLDSNKLPAEHPSGTTTNRGPANVENVRQFNSFAEFYPYYLSEHGNSTCRRLHFVGTSFALGFIVLAILRGDGVEASGGNDGDTRRGIPLDYTGDDPDLPELPARP